MAIHSFTLPRNAPRSRLHFDHTSAPVCSGEHRVGPFSLEGPFSPSTFCPVCFRTGHPCCAPTPLDRVPAIRDRELLDWAVPECPLEQLKVLGGK